MIFFGAMRRFQKEPVPSATWNCIYKLHDWNPVILAVMLYTDHLH